MKSGKLHYQDKSSGYGISHTRKRKILELVNNVKDKKVLDIGCSRGYLGKAVREIGNMVDGVEISDKAAEAAKKVLRRVYVFDIEDDWPNEVVGYDMALLAEVVEHIFDPVAVLKKVKEALKDNGEIIITTPNFISWTNRVGFFLGHFKYEKEGTFDFGHIRFFTYSYLKDVLEESGFKLIEENHILFPGKLSFILRFWPSLFASQFIIKAQKI